MPELWWTGNGDLSPNAQQGDFDAIVNTEKAGSGPR